MDSQTGSFHLAERFATRAREDHCHCSVHDELQLLPRPCRLRMNPTELALHLRAGGQRLHRRTRLSGGASSYCLVSLRPTARGASRKHVAISTGNTQIQGGLNRQHCPNPFGLRTTRDELLFDFPQQFMADPALSSVSFSSFG